MRVTLVISTLGAGGAERVLVGIANWLAEQQCIVTIISYMSTDDFYPLHSQVKRVHLTNLGASTNKFTAFKHGVARVYLLRHAIIESNPDYVISFIDKTNILTLLSCTLTKYKVIISERTNPTYYQISKIWSFLRNITYKKAYALVVQTDGLTAWAEKIIAKNKIKVIPNALDKERLHMMNNAAVIKTDQNWDNRIIAIGRFSGEKGHDLLVQACAMVLPKYKNWGLELIGDGILKQKLIKQISDAGIESQVYLHGQLKNPFGVLKGADIFVLPSRVEGFPNTLMEAMSLALPVISFDCPSGPSELIENNISGILVPANDVQAMADAIEKLINTPQLRQVISKNAVSVMRKYNEENIMGQWMSLLK